MRDDKIVNLKELADSVDYDALSRRVRLLMLLDGSERAGIAPIRLRRLHTYAYLSNVLAPVWKSRVFDGRILKRRGGPFYPTLQHDLDRLVGLGLVLITNLGHVIDEDNQWRLDGDFSLNQDLVGDALEIVNIFPQQRELRSFLLEIAYAVSALGDTEFDNVPSEDPTYSDSNVAFENVVDFGEWRRLNYSVNVTRHFASLSEQATPAELLHLYVRHLRRRISGER